MTDKEEPIFMAKLAEQAERYEEMVQFVRKFACVPGCADLTPEERNLFSAAYKNVVGFRRASWRIISSVEQKEESRGNAQNMKRIKEYREKVEQELSTTCNEILDDIDKFLLPAAATAESKVFFLKMKGDYYRYMAEYQAGDQRKGAADKALEFYAAASDIAEKELTTTHPTRLGLALNFSVFHYEIMGAPEEACTLAKKAFDTAIVDLERIQNEGSHKDSTLIMQLLRDNLSLWAADLRGDEKDE